MLGGACSLDFLICLAFGLVLPRVSWLMLYFVLVLCVLCRMFFSVSCIFVIFLFSHELEPFCIPCLYPLVAFK